jgi:transcriptional regulator with XRE-family HTH domain
MKEELAIVFGKNLLGTRLKKSLTQRELAHKLHLDHSVIAKLESGRVLPRRATVLKLSEALGVSPEDLTQAVPQAISKNEPPGDPELLSLVQQISVLDTRDRGTLKEVVEAMLTRYQLRELAARSRTPEFDRQAG